jgi:electron transfer flavoprotein beta subunit
VERIIVCVKPVPDPKHWDKVSLDPKTGTLRREGIPSVVNPLDRHAVEAALQLRDTAFSGGEVVLLSMAPTSAISSLKEMLAMGADRLVLLSDRSFAGSDTLATAAILAAAAKRLEPFNLVVCGDMTLDGSTAQVASQLAEFLDLPNVMHVNALAAEQPGVLYLSQKIENGVVRLRARTPLLISVAKEVNKPRYISFIGIIEADKKEVTVWSNLDLKLDPDKIGLAGSPTRVSDLFLKTSSRTREILQGNPKELAREFSLRLQQRGLL